MKFSLTVLICFTISFRVSFSWPNLPNKVYWDSFDVLKICNSGIKQSPIDLVESSAVQKSGSPITFINYNVKHNFSMENNGKTAKLFLTAGSTNVPTITSTHLSNDIFKLAQLHFHWGNMDKYGSEHTIDGLQFPIELHLVHFNTKYGETMEEALSVAHKSDNLAVLGVLFEITRSDMSILDPLINKLRYIQQEGTKTCVKSLVLKNLLPLDLNTFYSYEGSLTTPKCNEIVTWTVFKKRHSISSGQLDEFRKLISKGKPLVNNYRDIQNLNSRKVDFYSA